MGLREAGKPVVVSMGNCAASGKHLISAFSEQVSAERNTDIAKVRSLARGRVWSGLDALQPGLVDSLGGFSDAITTPIAAQASAAQSGVRHLPPGGLTTAAAGRLGLHATHGHTQVVTCHACRIDK
ncbi:TPA: hypothetical protein ACH3X3_009816 [Trebouxia sp. C0006]